MVVPRNVENYFGGLLGWKTLKYTLRPHLVSPAIKNVVKYRASEVRRSVLLEQSTNVWHCMNRASSCNMYTTNRMHRLFVIRLYFHYMLYMFRTVLVHLQGQSFYKLNVVFGMCRYDIQLIKRLSLKMDWYSPKHVECILKVMSNHKNFVHLVGYIHRVRTVLVSVVKHHNI